VSGFVDAGDQAAVAAVLEAALPALGLSGVLQQLARVPGLVVRPPQPGRLLRSAVPGVVAYGDQTARVEASGRVRLEHVVAGVVLSRDDVPPVRVAGTLAGLVTRSVADTGAGDEVSVLLTALRDAVAAGG
jgi:hypothetical protein